MDVTCYTILVLIGSSEQSEIALEAKAMSVLLNMSKIINVQEENLILLLVVFLQEYGMVIKT